MFTTTHVMDKGTQFEIRTTIAERPNGMFALVKTRDAGCEIIESREVDIAQVLDIVWSLNERHADGLWSGFEYAGGLHAVPSDYDELIGQD